MIKLIDVKEDATVFYGRKHLIQVIDSPPNQELLYDGKKVSSTEFLPRTRHIFVIEENEKQDFYEVIITVKSVVDGSSMAKAAGKVLLSSFDPDKSRARRTLRSINVRTSYVCNAAVIRNGESVCNEGILVNGTPLKDLKKELMLKPQD